MTWHVYRIYRVVALCALFCLHSALIGIIAVGMLSFEAGDYEALQFSMDIIVLFTILCFSAFKYKRRNAEPSRIPNLIAFSILSVFSFVGAIGLAVRSASSKGNGLCEDFASKHPGNCTEAAVAMTLTWVSVVIAGAGLVVSWFDKGSRMATSNSPYGWQRPAKELVLPKQYQQSKSSFHSSHSHVVGPTASYIPRPRDPYDTPRRKRSTRSQSRQSNPQRVPSNGAPIPPLPPLPSFRPIGLDTDSVAALRISRRQESRANSTQGGRKDLPELPPPTRRPPEDPYKREIRRMRHISPTDLFAQMGG
ncbi:hypothetical protein BDM02DRAFT_3187962 [Thelephora ganbajun]|uniref:Uncharacterized protein n=1 Tax=Thelephora ganbajun TaxID=370292 RepID=A0ACB6ZCL4_THEGA|nr:hypothetical protein BDM02DRAFT_3187962 [Thelephora ganbajun]